MLLRRRSGGRLDVDGYGRRLRASGAGHRELGVSEYLPVAAVHQQRDTAVGVSSDYRLGQGLFRLILKRLVDAQHKVLAGDRGLVLLEATR